MGTKSKLLLGAAGLAVVIQLFPAPAKTNPATDPARTLAAAMRPPDGVQEILRRACFDCHSNETVWPWYADVAPVSWLTRKHVVDGRRHLNFSEWLRTGEREFARWSEFEDICSVVRDKSMPVAGYDWLHPEAKLSDGERAQVCAWVGDTLPKR